MKRATYFVREARAYGAEALLACPVEPDAKRLVQALAGRLPAAELISRRYHFDKPEPRLSAI